MVAMRLRKVLESPVFWGTILAAFLNALAAIGVALIGRH
jgi:hypothetical protein